MATVFAETDRLFLRPLEKSELPRLVELLNVWEVVRCLEVMPFPFTLDDALKNYAEWEFSPCRAPEFYAMALKSDNLIIGGVGLQLPRGDYAEGDMEIGYWLAKDFWGQGFMSEAALAVATIGFARPATRALIATTAIDNLASQNVLRKIGLRNLGQAPRTYKALRGSNSIVKWGMTREEWERKT